MTTLTSTLTIAELKNQASELGLTADDVRAFGKLSAKQSWADAISSALVKETEEDIKAEETTIEVQDTDTMHQALAELKAERESYKEWEDSALAYMKLNRTETLNAQAPPKQTAIVQSPAFPLLLLIVCLLVVCQQAMTTLVRPTVRHTKKRCTSFWKEMQGLSATRLVQSIV